MLNHYSHHINLKGEKSMSQKDKVLVTGASSGIGAVYADRFAKRGHDLVLVARDRSRLSALAERLIRETGVTVEVLVADLIDPADLAKVEAKLRDDARIAILINNAGIALLGSFLDQSPDDLSRLIALNVTAPARLANVAAPRLARQGGGAIVNIASILALTPELGFEAYGGTKSFLLRLSQSLNLLLAPKGVYVQAVLPAATRTEIWERSGLDVNKIEGVMAVDDLVDAALVGFDRREAITIPPLPDDAQWQAYESARQAMLPNFRQEKPASRYGIVR